MRKSKAEKPSEVRQQMNSERSKAVTLDLQELTFDFHKSIVTLGKVLEKENWKELGLWMMERTHLAIRSTLRLLT